MFPTVGSLPTFGAQPGVFRLTLPRQSSAPLGFVPNPVMGLFCPCWDMNCHQPEFTYIMFAPPRRTVLLLPLISHAKPTRGAKVFLSRLNIWSAFLPS